MTLSVGGPFVGLTVTTGCASPLPANAAAKTKPASLFIHIAFLLQAGLILTPDQSDTSEESQNFEDGGTGATGTRTEATSQRPSSAAPPVLPSARDHQGESHLAFAAQRLGQQRITEAEAGAPLADTCGFGKYSIDLRLTLSETYPAAGDARKTLHNARSEQPDCQYAWGKADALHFCGMAHLRLGERELALQRLTGALEIRGAPGPRTHRGNAPRA